MKTRTISAIALGALLLSGAFVARAGLQARDRGLENQAALREADSSSV